MPSLLDYILRYFCLHVRAIGVLISRCLPKLRQVYNLSTHKTHHCFSPGSAPLRPWPFSAASQNCGPGTEAPDTQREAFSHQLESTVKDLPRTLVDEHNTDHGVFSVHMASYDIEDKFSPAPTPGLLSGTPSKNASTWGSLLKTQPLSDFIAEIGKQQAWKV